MAFGTGGEIGIGGMLALSTRSAERRRQLADERKRALSTPDAFARSTVLKADPYGEQRVLSPEWDAWFQALEEQGVEKLGADPLTAASSLGTIDSSRGLTRRTGARPAPGKPFDLMNRQPSFFGGQSLGGLQRAAKRYI